ncbi:hypothetical protein [Dehalobacterium formicoaceticum]|uniref:hypothetical protein n=1 Tax=Dehalobacterium formicoaceticum TaxID=51515 RepID=UPI0031F6D825
MFDVNVYFTVAFLLIGVLGLVLYLRLQNHSNHDLKEKLSNLQSNLELINNQKEKEEERISKLFNLEKQKQNQQTNLNKPVAPSDGIHVVNIADDCSYEGIVQLSPKQEEIYIDLEM